ncbi:MAG: short-chain fatty acyl-CoA regulator family protein, partial [Pseudomonadota bacterium]
SYLNLIEHNKRRIGGKLLLNIAALLDVEPAVLSEGTEAALLAALRDAATRNPAQETELDRIEEFAGRFPGWARLIQIMQERQSSLEQTVASLSDRMTHDPQLAEALHDMLGAVTGIRSTSSILASNDEIEPEWRMRFSRNINEDARRLAESSQSLVQYLDLSALSKTGDGTTPQDELDAWLARAEYRFAALEGVSKPEAAIASELRAGADLLVSVSATEMARDLLARYAADATALPKAELANALEVCGVDPGALATRLGKPLDLVMRRLAHLPPAMIEPHLSVPAPQGLGLAICDASGTFTYRKPVAGFALPRFGAACPLWPLYQALTRPGVPTHAKMVVEGRDTGYFDGYAVAVLRGDMVFHAPQRLEAHMLVVPAASAAPDSALVRPVGSGCRICAQSDCASRRERSVLASGL